MRAVAPDLEFVNGGGTGSVQHTAAEDAVTEIAAGSGLYVPRLFDNYTSVQRASGRAVRPAGGAPAGRGRGDGAGRRLSGVGGGGPGPAAGAVSARRGCATTRRRAPGEVQTPLLGPPADDLLIGDKVWFRHAKAGELCERFDELHLVEGDRVVATVPTYRGEGHTFL